MIPAVLLLLAAPVPAHRDDGWQHAPARDARIVAATYADCLWSANKRAIRAAVEQRVESSQPFAGLDMPPCFQGPMGARARYPIFVLRGLFFERMYHHDFDRLPPIQSFSGVPPVSYPVALRTVQTDVAKNYRGLVRIGDCAVRNAPAAARALLASRIASGAETRAMAAMEPSFVACQAPLPPVPFSAEMTRGTVAESLYRLSSAASAGRPSGGAARAGADMLVEAAE